MFQLNQRYTRVKIQQTCWPRWSRWRSWKVVQLLWIF